VFRFIPPCSPIGAKEVPPGDGWLHEVKFDGYRAQAHKVGSRVVGLGTVVTLKSEAQTDATINVA
jgi:ATP-dependent DNA ligase